MERLKENVMRGWMCAAAAVMLAAGAQAATVSVEHGNIVVNGKPITHSGHDSDPVASRDGKRIVFTRTTGKSMDCQGNGAQSDAYELWTANADGSGARKLLGVAPNDDLHKSICGFQGAQFSSNGNLLYFETPAWATSGAIHVYDFRAGKEHYVIDGDDVMVLANCDAPEYRDKLIVTQHKYFVFSGSYDWPWLISPQGKTLGLVGGDDANLKEIVKDACT
jgi:hypothetical protein